MKISRKRIGSILILVAISGIVLVGVLAVTVDGGMLYQERRHAQAAADAAALAGATHLYKNKNFLTQGSSTVVDAAKASALEVAKINGYPNDEVTVNIPPATGPFTGKAGHCEVIIHTKRQRYFSVLMGDDDLPVGARAVARGLWRPPAFGIIVLDPTDKDSLTLSGSGSLKVIVNEGSVIVNSSAGDPEKSTNKDGQGAVDINLNATLKAKSLNVWGTADVTGTLLDSNGDTMEAIEGSPPEPDPYATIVDIDTRAGEVLDARAPSEFKNVFGSSDDFNTKWNKIQTDTNLAELKAIFDTFKAQVDAGTRTQDSLNRMLNPTRSVYVVWPGKYRTGQGGTPMPANNFGNGDLIIMKQGYDSAGTMIPSANAPDLAGVYYLTDGFTSNGANIVMDPNTQGGMLFYNEGIQNSDSISIAGNANGIVETIGLTSPYPQTGQYFSLGMFQNRESTNTVSITGNGTFSMLGSFYARSGEFFISGNGASSTVSSQLVADQITFGGNGQLVVDYANGPRTPIRVFGLVE